MTKTQRWDWAITLQLEELDDHHLHAAYKLNWDNLCKFDSCRKNCKKILCIGCFDRSWIDNESPNSSFESYDNPSCDEKRTNLKTFVGLKNLGATCYVNCLLQLWFHNPALRKAIYEWKNLENEQQPGKDGDQMLQLCDVRDDQKQPSPKKNNTISQSKRVLEDVEETSTKPSKKPNRKVDENKTLLNPSQNVTKNDSSPTQPTTSDKIKNPDKDLVPTNPIEQLQLIFARLQFTNKKSIDPYNFIQSLALNAAEQQDAQEFGNLFMEFLERTFSNQPNSFVSKIIQTQFCGKYSYATICDSCRHNSLSDSKFYELDLSIQNLETLHDCLNEYFRPVALDGKYNCGHCLKAQSAHRKIILKSLPPTLNLQLLRFVYDVQRNVRQKLNSHLIFPEVLDMNPYLDKNNNVRSTLARQQYNQQSFDSRSNIYFLSAVLIHRGSSPHSGHYIAHIKDRISKDWYKFNDDSVERIGPQLQISTDGENISIVEDKTEHIKVIDPVTNKVTRIESKSLKSKTAYMLVYQAQDNETLTYPRDHSEKWQLPDHLQTAVAEENSRSEEIFESLQLAREVDLQIMVARRTQVKTIYNKLVCRSPNEEFEFISKKWLQNWLTNSSTSAKFPPIDNSDLMCIHDKLDFRKIDQAKCVKSIGADDLYAEFGGGPRLRSSAMCRDCVLLEMKLIQLKHKMKEDQKFITSQAKFKLDAPYDFNDAYIVGKNSYRDWQALVMVQFKRSHPELLTRRQSNDENATNEINNHGDSDDDNGNNKTNGGSKENQEPKPVVTSTNSNAISSSNSTNQDGDSDSESDDEAMEKFVFNSDVLCDHNQLINECSAWRIVPKEVWQIFKNYFGNNPERPLIEYNANTLMCADCKRQEVEQQEIGDLQKQKAHEQKNKLPDLFHNRKRASWCSMIPGDVHYALDRKFLCKWQKFIRNPCNQDQPTDIVHANRLVCEHGRSLYDQSNSNPVMPESPFVLIDGDELNILKNYYPMDYEIKFFINPELVDEKIKLHLATQKTSPSKNQTQQQSPPFDVSKTSVIRHNAQHCGSDDEVMITNEIPPSQNLTVDTSMRNEPLSLLVAKKEQQQKEDQLDLADIDWSDCVISEPRFCSECYQAMKQKELEKLLDYESATIYITKVESSASQSTNGSTTATTNGNNNNDNNICQSTTANNNDFESAEAISKQHHNQQINDNTNNNSDGTSLLAIKSDSTPASWHQQVHHDNEAGDDMASKSKRRSKIYAEDEGNDFVPPGITKQVATSSLLPSPSSSLLRRTTRRNRNRQQAYTIKPNQTLLELKKEIFSRCQVLPVDQRLFLNDQLLDDNDKTMSDLKIVPGCSLNLEVDKPIGDMTDLIEDEPNSRKSYAQPETGFKGSLLLSNTH